MAKKKKEEVVTKLGQELTESLTEVLESEQKNNEVKVEVMEQAKVEPIYTEKALSTCQVGTDWYLVEIPYNPNTKEVGPLKMENFGYEKMQVINQFKIEAVNRKVLKF